MTADTAEGGREKIYSSFEEFLKTAVHDYYQQGGRSNKANFIALLIASGEIMSLAVDSFKSGAGAKKIAIGAVGVIALRIGLRYALSGPLGIVLAGATAASLIAYFVRNRREVTGKIGRYRRLVQDTRQSYEKLQSDYRDGRLDRDQRNLMIDGLMNRFVKDVEQGARSTETD